MKSLADSKGVAVSAFVAGMVHERVKGHKLDVAERAWIAEHLEMNLIRRAKADAKTAAGYYKRKRRGRPRKPGPRGKKRVSVGGADPCDTVDVILSNTTGADHMAI